MPGLLDCWDPNAGGLLDGLDPNEGVEEFPKAGGLPDPPKLKLVVKAAAAVVVAVDVAPKLNKLLAGAVAEGAAVVAGASVFPNEKLDFGFGLLWPS